MATNSQSTPLMITIDAHALFGYVVEAAVMSGDKWMDTVLNTFSMSLLEDKVLTLDQMRSLFKAFNIPFFKVNTDEEAEWGEVETEAEAEKNDQ